MWEFHYAALREIPTTQTLDEKHGLNHLQRILESMDKARAEGDEKLAKSIQELTFHMNRFGHASALQERKEILSHVYQKAAGYTNLVMIGGYASAFAIWQLTKEHLSTEQSMVVGFMIITSVILFAGFEVFKMISHAFFFRRLNRVLEKEVPEHEHTAAWKSAWDEHQASESRMWALFLTPTVFTGFGTGFYLLWVFATNLANGI